MVEKPLQLSDFETTSVRFILFGRDDQGPGGGAKFQCTEPPARELEARKFKVQSSKFNLNQKL
eukprot:3231112-Rhodomonas_salina.2